MTTDTAEGAGKRASTGELTLLEAELLAALKRVRELSPAKTWYEVLAPIVAPAISKAEAVAAEK